MNKCCVCLFVCLCGAELTRVCWWSRSSTVSYLR